LSLKLTLEPFSGYCFAIRPVPAVDPDAASGAPSGDERAEDAPAVPAEINGVDVLAQAVAQDHADAPAVPNPRRARRGRLPTR
jgi:hypothetical protein